MATEETKMATEGPIQCAMRPIHPGEILRDELDELGFSARAFARALDIPVNRVTQILRGQRGISADSALGLARYFGTSAARSRGPRGRGRIEPGFPARGPRPSAPARHRHR